MLGEKHHEPSSLIRVTLQSILDLNLELFVHDPVIKQVSTATVLHIRVHLDFVDKFECIADRSVGYRPFMRGEVEGVVLVDANVAVERVSLACRCTLGEEKDEQ